MEKIKPNQLVLPNSLVVFTLFCTLGLFPFGLMTWRRHFPPLFFFEPSKKNNFRFECLRVGSGPKPRLFRTGGKLLPALSRDFLDEF